MLWMGLMMVGFLAMIFYGKIFGNYNPIDFVTRFTDFRRYSHLLALYIFPALPLGEPGPPVLENIRLGELLTLPFAESALRFDRGDCMHLQ